MIVERDQGCQALFDRGLFPQISQKLGIARVAPYAWRRVPSLRVLKVAKIAGMSPSQLRPDLYPPRRRKNGK